MSDPILCRVVRPFAPYNGGERAAFSAADLERINGSAGGPYLEPLEAPAPKPEKPAPEPAPKPRARRGRNREGSVQNTREG